MKRLCRNKFADTENIHVVDNNKSLEAINSYNNLYDLLMDEHYTMFDEQNGEKRGPWGCYAYCIDENNEPIMYLLEIYSFLAPEQETLKEKSSLLHKTETVLIEHKLDDYGNVVSTTIKPYSNSTWKDVQREIIHGTTLSNGLIEHCCKDINDFESALEFSFNDIEKHIENM